MSSIKEGLVQVFVPLDAIRDSILETAILADHMVKVEPRGLHGERSIGGVDGLIDIIKQGPAEPSATGVATSTTRGRIAFDVFTCADEHRLQNRAHRKIQRFENAVRAAGDEFVAPAFTPRHLLFRDPVVCDD